MPHLLALDQGTTSSRAIVFDERGQIKASAQREFAQHFPQPGWVEHDALEIVQSQLAVMQQAVAQSGTTPIVAIGITNQRETTVVWHRKTGQPIAPAIVWQDRRTAAMCDTLKAAGHSALIQSKTGLVLDAYFSGTKLRWLLDNIPHARQQAQAGELAFGTIDTWLIWQLTGGQVHATDPSNASRTLLFNLQTQTWDPELLALFDIPASLLPEIRPSSGHFGDASVNGQRIPIRGVAGDQQAALFGQSCLQPGQAKNTYGTGCFMLMNTGSHCVPSQNQLLTTAAWQLGKAPLQYALEGSVFMAGAIVQWLRDGLGIIQQASEIEALAASVPDSGGVVLIPAFTGLGAPHWDAYARASLMGMTRGSNKAHIARAALDAIANQTADVLSAMQADSGIALTALRVDGGASANKLLMQIQADVLQVPIHRPAVLETTALGAAYLAGLAAGVWSSTDELAAQHHIALVIEPRRGADEMAAQRALWQKGLRRTQGWLSA
jgi:glycerol kinase